MLLVEGENHILLAIRPDFSYRMHRTYLTPSPEIHVVLTELFCPEVHSLSGFCPIPGIFELLDHATLRFTVFTCHQVHNHALQSKSHLEI